jgi:hypothetical protein
VPYIGIKEYVWTCWHVMRQIRAGTSRNLLFYLGWWTSVNFPAKRSKSTLKKETFVHSRISRINSFVFRSKGKCTREHSLEIMQFLLDLRFKNLFSLYLWRLLSVLTHYPTSYLKRQEYSYRLSVNSGYSCTNIVKYRTSIWDPCLTCCRFFIWFHYFL